MAWYTKPKTRLSCLDPGDYDAELTACERTRSKAGNDMAALKFKVLDNGRTVVLRDWIVQGKYAAKKVEALARSLGREDDHKAGTFRLGKQLGGSVRLRVGVENHATYGWQNRVEGYLDFDKGTGPTVAQITPESEFGAFDFTDPNPPY